MDTPVGTGKTTGTIDDEMEPWGAHGNEPITVRKQQVKLLNSMSPSSPDPPANPKVSPTLQAGQHTFLPVVGGGKGGVYEKVSLRISFTRAVNAQPLDTNSGAITGFWTPESQPMTGFRLRTPG